MKGTLQSAAVFSCRENSKMHSCHLATEMPNCPFEHPQKDNIHDSLAGSLPPGFIHRFLAWKSTWATLGRYQLGNVDFFLTVAVMHNTHGSIFSFTEITEHLKLEVTYKKYQVQFPCHFHLWKHRIVEWFGLESTLKVIYLQAPCNGQRQLPLDQAAQNTSRVPGNFQQGLPMA